MVSHAPRKPAKDTVATYQMCIIVDRRPARIPSHTPLLNRHEVDLRPRKRVVDFQTRLMSLPCGLHPFWLSHVRAYDRRFAEGSGERYAKLSPQMLHVAFPCSRGYWLTLTLGESRQARKRKHALSRTELESLVLAGQLFSFGKIRRGFCGEVA